MDSLIYYNPRLRKCPSFAAFRGGYNLIRCCVDTQTNCHPMCINLTIIYCTCFFYILYIIPYLNNFKNSLDFSETDKFFEIIIIWDLIIAKTICKVLVSLAFAPPIFFVNYRSLLLLKHFKCRRFAVIAFFHLSSCKNACPDYNFLLAPWKSGPVASCASSLCKLLSKKKIFGAFRRQTVD